MDANHRRPGGFTLLELLIVVALIGLIWTIAVPSYSHYVVRAQRTEAKAALLQLATNQERFYFAQRRYGATADLPALGFPSGKSERGTYSLSIAGADTLTYTATATPAAGASIDLTRDSMCTSFSITAQGVRSATGTAPDNCW